MNEIASKLEAAQQTAPYLIEKERYHMAAAEIRRLQEIVDKLTPPDTDPGELKVYAGSPWHADESHDCVRIFRGELQIIKATKRHTPYEEYWPDAHMLKWMLSVLNYAESQQITTLDT